MTRALILHGGHSARRVRWSQQKGVAIKRLSALLIAVGLLMALPVATATAQNERFEIVVDGVESPVGVDADGAILTAGTFVTSIEGVVVETGTIEGRYYDHVTGVHGTRRFVDDSTGNVVETELKAHLVGMTDSPTVLSYVATERITFSDDGFGGHGVVEGISTVSDDGSTFVLVTSATFIINP